MLLLPHWFASVRPCVICFVRRSSRRSSSNDAPEPPNERRQFGGLPHKLLRIGEYYCCCWWWWWAFDSSSCVSVDTVWGQVRAVGQAFAKIISSIQLGKLSQIYECSLLEIMYTWVCMCACVFGWRDSGLTVIRMKESEICLDSRVSHYYNKYSEMTHSLGHYDDNKRSCVNLPVHCLSSLWSLW